MFLSPSLSSLFTFELQGAYEFHIVRAGSVSYLTVCDFVDSVEVFHHSLIMAGGPPFRIFLLRRSHGCVILLHYVNAERRVSLFRVEKDRGFGGGHLLSVADKLIPYYRRSRLLITRSSQLSTPRTGNFSVLQIEPAYVLEFISV